MWSESWNLEWCPEIFCCCEEFDNELTEISGDRDAGQRDNLSLIKGDAEEFG